MKLASGNIISDEEILLQKSEELKKQMIALENIEGRSVNQLRTLLLIRRQLRSINDWLDLSHDVWF